MLRKTVSVLVIILGLVGIALLFLPAETFDGIGAFSALIWSNGPSVSAEMEQLVRSTSEQIADYPWQDGEVTVSLNKLDTLVGYVWKLESTFYDPERGRVLLSESTELTRLLVFSQSLALLAIGATALTGPRGKSGSNGGQTLSDSVAGGKAD